MRFGFRLFQFAGEMFSKNIDDSEFKMLTYLSPELLASGSHTCMFSGNLFWC